MLSPRHREEHGGGLIAGAQGMATTSSFRSDATTSPALLGEGASLWNGAGHPPKAGEKRQAAAGQSLLFNKRHCSDGTQQSRHQTPSLQPKTMGWAQALFGRGLNAGGNPRKRASGVAASNQPHSITLDSKKVKTESETSPMETCQDEPKVNHRDAAADVWNFIGVG